MNKFFIEIIIISLLFFNCNNKHKENIKDEVKIIKLNFNDVKIDSVSNYFSDYKIIPLETNENSLIKRIDRLIIHENKIYILDQDLKSIFMFNENGIYINKIFNVGKGPGEYVQLRDFTITDDSHIVLHSSSPYKLIFYDMNGKYIFEKKINNHYYNISYAESNYIFYDMIPNKLNNFKLLIKNKNSNSFDKYLESKLETTISYTFSHKHLLKSTRLFFNEGFQNTIYTYANNKIIPYYYISCGDNNLSKYYLNKIYNTKLNNISKIVWELRDQNICFSITEFREYKDFISFKLNNYYTIIYSKINHQANFIKLLIDDLTGLPVKYYAHDGKDNIFLSILSARLFKSISSGRKKKDKYMEFDVMKNIGQELESWHNPILIFYE